MPPFRDPIDPYDHAGKLADLVAHYERVKKRANRATASAQRKIFVLLACAFGLAGWTGAVMDWSYRLEQTQAIAPLQLDALQQLDVQAQLDECTVVNREWNNEWMRGGGELANCRSQLLSAEGTAQARLEALEAMSIELEERGDELVGCEADVDVLQHQIDHGECTRYGAMHMMGSAMVHEDSW